MNFSYAERHRSEFSIKKQAVIFLVAVLTAFCYSSSAFATTTIIDSTNAGILPTAKKPNHSFIKETGYITTPTGSFSTNSACPTGFNPYVSISVGEVSPSTGGNYYNYATTSFKTCVTSITTAGSNVNVSYTYSATVNEFRDYRWYTYETGDPFDTGDTGLWRNVRSSYTDHSTGEGFYYSDSKQYDLFTHEDFPHVTSFQGSTTDDTKIKKISWTLFCYPTGMAIPSTTCP